MIPRNGHNREEGFFFRLVLEGFFLKEALVALPRLVVGRFTTGSILISPGKAPEKSPHP